MSNIDRMRFQDRRAAGAELGRALAPRYGGRSPVVLGLLRGGLPVAAEVARELGGDLDLMSVRKIGAPGSTELAIGAVTSNGARYVNWDLVQMLEVPRQYVEQEAERQKAIARSREEALRRGVSPVPVYGRLVILVDDGLATGATMKAAVRSVRNDGPSEVVVAAPVGAQSSCEDLRDEADDVFCLHTPEPFFAVGLYYEDFEETPDEEVEGLLLAASRR